MSDNPTQTVAQAIASLVVAIRNCEKSGNAEWKARHSDRLASIINEHMPSGSGIDCGTKIVHERSGTSRLTFECSYHHMNEHGYYDGWTEHLITVRPDFVYGLHIVVSGRDRNGIKDYLAETFSLALSEQIPR